MSNVTNLLRFTRLLFNKTLIALTYDNHCIGRGFKPSRSLRKCSEGSSMLHVMLLILRGVVGGYHRINLGWSRHGESAGLLIASLFLFRSCFSRAARPR